MAKGKEVNTLDFWVKQRAGHKRNYVFNVGKALRCDHPELRLIVRGTPFYRCPECNYAFLMNAAYCWPLHFLPILGGFTIMSFAKEFGVQALQEVLRRPIGQTDGTAHKPVLPEGKSFVDVLKALEGVDTTSADHGAAQLVQVIKALHEPRKLRGKNAEREASNSQQPSVSPLPEA